MPTPHCSSCDVIFRYQRQQHAACTNDALSHDTLGCTKDHNARMYGTKLSTVASISHTNCCHLCQGSGPCVGFTFRDKEFKCDQYSDITGIQKAHNHTSGVNCAKIPLRYHLTPLDIRKMPDNSGTVSKPNLGSHGRSDGFVFLTNSPTVVPTVAVHIRVKMDARVAAALMHARKVLRQQDADAFAKCLHSMSDQAQKQFVVATADMNAKTLAGYVEALVLMNAEAMLGFVSTTAGLDSQTRAMYVATTLNSMAGMTTSEKAAFLDETTHGGLGTDNGVDHQTFSPAPGTKIPLPPSDLINVHHAPAAHPAPPRAAGPSVPYVCSTLPMQSMNSKGEYVNLPSLF